MRRLVAGALVVGLAGPAAAEAVVAVPDLDLNDTSGLPAPGIEDRVSLFADTLRFALAATGEVVVVRPDCGDCSPAKTAFATMADATRDAGADLLLVGQVHKISTLIGTIRLKLLDLPGDRVLCSRDLTYRGDTDEAFARAAEFGARDILAHCLP